MEEKLSVTKVATEENPADVLTKALKPEVMNYHTDKMGFRHENTRASSALEVNEVRRSHEQRRPLVSRGQPCLAVHSQELNSVKPSRGRGTGDAAPLMKAVWPKPQ